MMRLEPAVAAGLVGLVVVQFHNIYTGTAPKLRDLRAAGCDDWYARQALFDADLYVGTLAFIIGGSTSVLIRRWEPAVLALVGFGIISLYHHAVLRGGVVPKGE